MHYSILQLIKHLLKTPKGTDCFTWLQKPLYTSTKWGTTDMSINRKAGGAD